MFPPQWLLRVRNEIIMAWFTSTTANDGRQTGKRRVMMSSDCGTSTKNRSFKEVRQPRSHMLQYIPMTSIRWRTDQRRRPLYHVNRRRSLRRYRGEWQDMFMEPTSGKGHLAFHHGALACLQSARHLPEGVKAVARFHDMDTCFDISKIPIKQFEQLRSTGGLSPALFEE